MSEQWEDNGLRALFARLGFITRSRGLMALLGRAKKAADISDVNILIEGETGTGKQVLAQAIHKLDRKRGACNFVTVHCSTITEALAESELFGHTRGAFSGAVQERKGLFQSAASVRRRSRTQAHRPRTGECVLSERPCGLCLC